MRGWHGIALSALVALAAFQVGYFRGAQDCPDQAKKNAARQAAINRDVGLALSAPTGRDAACDQVFEIIEGELRREAIDEQDARDRSDPFGE